MPARHPRRRKKGVYEELSKRGVSAVPLAAELNWRYVNFRDLKKPDAAVFALLKPCSLIVELNLSGASKSATPIWPTSRV